MSERKVRLTKKRLAALDTALSLDDVLYSKWLRMREDLSRYERRIGRKECIAAVLLTENGITRRLQLERIDVTAEGMIVRVR